MKKADHYTGIDVRPPDDGSGLLAGIGVGAHYFGREDGSFGNDFGASLVVRSGLILSLENGSRVEIRIPFHWIFNQAGDTRIGFDIGFLFADRFGNQKRLKL